MKQDLKQNQEVMTSKISEFSLDMDSFIAARHRGVKSWIIKHILFKKNKFLITLFIILSVISIYFSSMIMITIGHAIDQFSQGDNTQILWFMILFLLFGVGAPLIGLLSTVFRETLAQRLERNVRKEFYLNLLAKSQSFHDNQFIGDIMARATNDVRVLSFLVSPAISQIITACINVIIPIVLIIVYYSFQLTIVPLGFCIIFIVYLRRYLRKLEVATQYRRIAFGNMNTVLNEELSGIEIVKSMAQEKQSVDKYKESAIKYRDWGIKLGYIQARYLPILFLSIAITLGLTYSVILYNAGGMTIGDILGYIGLLFLLRFPVNVSIDSLLIVKEALAGAERLIETMNQKSEITEDPNAIVYPIEGKIRFKNVSFSYPGTRKEVLKKIDFEILPGKTVAIVGTTGSGKTTLVKLLSRLFDVSKGQILIDDRDVRNFTLQSLRNQIAYIEQDIFLFSKSIYDNIAFGRNATNDEIIGVSKEAQAHEFITNLPEGYDTVIGERGVTLSGGERQRVAIARAFLSDPRILILDDSSSAIDSETEEEIQTAITRILYGRTTFIITHRLSQIRTADHIIVLNQGKIVAQGTHKQLLQNSEEYRKIFVKRFDKTLDELVGETS